MPKVTEDTISAKEILDALTRTHARVIPIVCRKVNIGGFETIDAGLAIELPVAADAIVTKEDFEDLKQRLVEVTEQGFALVSEETFARYMAIREQLSGNPEKT